MPPVSRRRFLSTGAAAAGGAAVAGLVGSANADAASASEASKRTGTIRDVKHVVVVMQENRSFDHYYGSLGGVRGYADDPLLAYPGGSDVLHQPDAKRTDGGALLPWHMDTARFDAQEAGDLDHSWPGTHAAWADGAWNGWIAAKTEETMGFFRRADIPWQYALADAFTVCDHYFCSIQGPTTPNRLFHWSGMIDPGATDGGPAISNPDDYNPVYRWTTYPERLQAAGVSWQVYANKEVGDGSGADGYVGDYGDNPLWLFQAYHDALASSDPKVRQLALRGGLHDGWLPNSGQGKNLDHLLEQFIGDCKSGSLPTVSWVVAPYAYSEHPQARPVDGANYVNRALEAIWSNRELWESTVVLLNFDENDGFFDHVPAPFPPAGTAAEYVQGLPVGLGPRVPMTVVSPWSHGGWVDSQTFDHTSVLRFLEQITGVREPNISAWRRAVCGDLTSCFDFGSFDASVPKLPDTAALVRIADKEKSLPQASPPAPGAQHLPKPEYATRPRRVLPYQQQASASRGKHGTLDVSYDNLGSTAASLLFYDNTDDTAAAFHARPLLVGPRKSTTVEVASGIDGAYDVQLFGPDGFVRVFSGSTAARVEVRATVHAADRSLALRLTNDSTSTVRFALNDADGNTARTVPVAAGKSADVTWHSEHGRYDVIVACGSGSTKLVHRFAGGIEST